ncbi:hypothetical protein R6G99_10035, partial [Actinotignum timonense]|nr:hypothetical protein [Actinotignum timonense]
MSGFSSVPALRVAGLFGAYRWTQSRYYVANNNGIVTIYQGIPQRLGPLEFSHAAEATDLQVRDLTPVAQDRLATPITRAIGVNSAGPGNARIEGHKKIEGFR